MPKKRRTFDGGLQACNSAGVGLTCRNDYAEDARSLRRAFFLEYVVDFLLDFCFVKHLFEVVGDLLAFAEHCRPFFKKCDFKFAALVFFLADLENKDRMSQGESQKHDEDLNDPENEIFFEHPTPPRFSACAPFSAALFSLHP